MTAWEKPILIYPSTVICWKNRKGERDMNIAIITGASSGIGKEFALQLDAGLYTIDEFWLIARRKDRLEELACDLDHMAKTIPLDLTQEADMEHLRDLLRKERPAVRMLINCSGYGIMGQFSEIDSREQSGMIDLNCRALTEITHACLPYMKKTAASSSWQAAPPSCPSPASPYMQPANPTSSAFPAP